MEAGKNTKAFESLATLLEGLVQAIRKELKEKEREKDSLFYKKISYIFDRFRTAKPTEKNRKRNFQKQWARKAGKGLGI